MAYNVGQQNKNVEYYHCNLQVAGGLDYRRHFFFRSLLPDLQALPVRTAHQARLDLRAGKATLDHKDLGDHKDPKDQWAL